MEHPSRQRRRLERARENGYLNAMCRDRDTLLRAHSFWCWKLRLPLVWFERNSPRSRYGRVCLDLFTTPNLLTQRGQDSFVAMGASASPHECVFINIPVRELEQTARAVFRAATAFGNYELRQRTYSLEVVR